jgi:thiol-disulfide isomerase/thioredoxin
MIMLMLIAFYSLVLTDPSRGVDDAVHREYLALVGQWQQAQEEFAGRMRQAKDDEARREVRKSYPKPIFQVRFMELARTHPKDPGVIDPLVWVLVNPWEGAQAERNYAEAIEILVRDFLSDEKLEDACWVLAGPFNSTVSAGGLHSGAEGLLRAALAKSPHRTVRAAACYSLASYLQAHSLWRTGGMTKDRADRMAEESAGLFEQVIGEYGNVRIKTGRTLSDMASSALFEIRSLVVGKLAPEIDGEDLDGRPLKMSDHRGKVIVLTFWATWCGPCMAMIPHELSLARRMADKPFILLGVNGDDDRDAAKRARSTTGMTWRSWRGGRDGEIIRRWNVDSWPTVYVLDGKGVIRYKNVSGEKLDRAVDELVRELRDGNRDADSY